MISAVCSRNCPRAAAGVEKIALATLQAPALQANSRTLMERSLSAPGSWGGLYVLFWRQDR